ncbi:MAG: PfkB family carbohydrate kinase [Flavobacteriales bacterium AspAUS03]
MKPVEKKGVNQAITAARLESVVRFISKLSQNLFGKQPAQLLNQEDIDTTQLLYSDTTNSGIDLITVDKKRGNHIIVIPKERIPPSRKQISGHYLMIYTQERSSSSNWKYYYPEQNSQPNTPSLKEEKSSIILHLPT